MFGLQRALSLVYPDQCILCPELVDVRGGLCGACWREFPFIRGPVCDTCGAALPGLDDGGVLSCDDCMSLPRPWRHGRAALSYAGAARRFVLALKHGDRPELAQTAAVWLRAAGRPFLREETLVVPVPAHWSRLVARRYNQSAELARALSQIAACDYAPSTLARTRRTSFQDDLGVVARFQNVSGAIVPHPSHGGKLSGRDVCLIDDVMTSGATLSAATVACHEAGAQNVSVLALARVHKSP